MKKVKILPPLTQKETFFSKKVKAFSGKGLEHRPNLISLIHSLHLIVKNKTHSRHKKLNYRIHFFKTVKHRHLLWTALKTLLSTVQSVKQTYNRRLSKKAQIFLHSALSRKMFLFKISLKLVLLKDLNLHASLNHYSHQIEHLHLSNLQKKSSSSSNHQLHLRPIHCSRHSQGSHKELNSNCLPITLQKKASQWLKSQQTSRWIKVSSLSKGLWLSIRRVISVVGTSHKNTLPILSSIKTQIPIH